MKQAEVLGDPKASTKGLINLRGDSARLTSVSLCFYYLEDELGTEVGMRSHLIPT